MSRYAPVGGRLFTGPFILFSILALIGIVFIIERFIFGLGAVTNLNNGYPWGLWVVVDIVIGTAFACGGFALALAIYVANKGEYHPLMRPALLGSLLGYALGGGAAFVDMGRYWNFYQVFNPSVINLSSVMLEVALCVFAYIVVLAIEFSPTVLERFGARNAKRALGRVLFVFIALGILLPTMHQSSLGSLLVSLGHKVDPLWQAYEMLPLLFLLSAITMGFSIVVFEGSLSSLRFRTTGERPLLEKLGPIIVGMLVAYLVVRFGQLLLSGSLGRAFAGDTRSLAFWIENLLYLVPVVVLASAGMRRKPQALFLAAISMLLAASVYRINAFLVGFNPPPGYQYFPSVTELLVTVGMISIEVVIFLYVIKRFPVLHRAEQAA